MYLFYWKCENFHENEDIPAIWRGNSTSFNNLSIWSSHILLKEEILLKEGKTMDKLPWFSALRFFKRRINIVQYHFTSPIWEGLYTMAKAKGMCLEFTNLDRLVLEVTKRHIQESFLLKLGLQYWNKAKPLKKYRMNNAYRWLCRGHITVQLPETFITVTT